MPTYPISDHCDGQRFFNPHTRPRPLSDVVTWLRTRQKQRWPEQVPLSPYPLPGPVAAGEISVSFIGHSTFLIRTVNTALITDPVFTRHVGPFGRLGPRRVRAPGLAPSVLPAVDLVLVSHNHYDHLQPSSLRLFADRASYVTPLGVAAQLGLPAQAGSHTSSHARPTPGVTRKIAELDWWQSTTVGAAAVTCVPAQHFSARTPFDRDKTLWCGYLVSVDGVTIYFAGDSGYSPHFAEIAARCPPIDVALLPIGAYEPRWFMGPVHMNPDEAVRAHVDVRARISIGMHFGTFQLTDEGIDEPVRALERARERHRVSADAFRVLDFGESLVVEPERNAQEHGETRRLF